MSDAMREDTLRPICLVTGATSGIGEAVATELARRGADVLAVARDAERGNAAAERVRRRHPAARVEVLTADLSALGEVRALAQEVIARRDRLDVLILDAAVARPRRELTPDGYEVDFATNHLSPFLLTQELRGLLSASAPARVVVMSSSGHRRVRRLDLDGLVTGRNFHHLRTYSATKLLNVLFTAELGRRLLGTGVTANAADPGFVRTGLGRDLRGPFGLFLTAARAFQVSPSRGAVTPVHLALAGELDGVTGGYFAGCRPATVNPLARDTELAERLWDLSTQLIS